MSLLAGSDNASGPVGSRSKVRETLTAWALIAPAFIIFGLFAFRPLYRLVHLGLHQQNRTGTAERWVGWSQYRETLTGDEFQTGCGTRSSSCSTRCPSGWSWACCWPWRPTAG